MSSFDILIEYRRGSDAATAALNNKWVTVEASTPKKAKQIARGRFDADWRHRNSEIVRVSHVGGSVEAKEPPAYTLFSVGQRVKLRQGYYKGETVVVRATYSSERGTRMVAAEGPSKHFVTSEDQLLTMSRPETTIEYWVLYPSGASYVREYGPVRSSQHGLDQLVQIKVTKQDGRIINKELLP